MRGREVIGSFFRSFATERRMVCACVLIALAFSCISVVSFVYMNAQSLSDWPQVLSMPAMMRSIALHAIALFLVSYILMYCWKLADARAKTGVGAGSQTVHGRHRLLMFFLVMFAIWLVWIIPHYPGTLRDDTLAQMFQWYGVEPYHTRHPLTDTLVFGAFFSLGDALGAREIGIFIYIVIQAALTALGFAYVLRYLEKVGIPRGIVWAILIFYSLARVVYQPVDTMSKDALNAVFLVPAMVLVIDMIRRTGVEPFGRRRWIALAVLVFMCIVTKRIMLYVFILAFGIVIIWMFAKRYRARGALLAIVIPVLAATLLWNPFLEMQMCASVYKTYEIFSIPMQQVCRALIEHPDALDDAERATLSRYADIDSAVAVYNPYRSDEVNETVIDDPDYAALFEAWVQLGIRYPDSYFRSFMNLTAGWYSMLNRVDFGHDSTLELMSEPRMQGWSEQFFDGDRQAADAFFSQFDLSHPAWAQPILKIEEWFDGVQRRIPLLSSYGFYCFFLPLLVLFYCLARRKVRGILALVIPFALVATFVVGPIALYWYTIPIVYVSPLVACVPMVFAQPGSNRQRA